MAEMTAEQLSAKFTGNRGAEPQPEAAPATSNEPVVIGFDDPQPSGQGGQGAQSGQDTHGEAQAGGEDADGNPIPYQRFKQVNDRLKEAKQELEQLRASGSDQQTQQRIQALEERLTQSQSVKEPEPDPFVEKVRKMVGDEDVRDDRDNLMLEMAEELSQLRNQSKQNRKMSENAQVDQYVKELRGRMDTALKDATVVNKEGARAYLVSKLQQDINTDLKTAVKEFADWETQTYGSRAGQQEAAPEAIGNQTAPKLSQTGGSQGAAPQTKTNKRRPKNFNEMRDYITGNKLRRRFKRK